MPFPWYPYRKMSISKIRDSCCHKVQASYAWSIIRPLGATILRHSVRMSDRHLAMSANLAMDEASFGPEVDLRMGPFRGSETPYLELYCAASRTSIEMIIASVSVILLLFERSKVLIPRPKGRLTAACHRAIMHAILAGPENSSSRGAAGVQDTIR